jgi:hypothetical protein
MHEEETTAAEGEPEPRDPTLDDDDDGRHSVEPEDTLADPYIPPGYDE